MSSLTTITEHPSDNAILLHKFKVVFLGEQAVGKSSLITRFVYGSFDSSYNNTIGIDFLTKNFCVGDSTVRLQLWDTTGQERFRCLMPSYIRDSTAAIVVYDIGNEETFQQTTKWIDDVRAERGNDVIVFLVGNKTDLSEHRKVSIEEGEDKARKLNALFIEACAKSGHNVVPLFKQIANALLEIQLPKEKVCTTMDKVNLQDQDFQQSKVAQGGWCSC